MGDLEQAEKALEEGYAGCYKSVADFAEALTEDTAQIVWRVILITVLWPMRWKRRVEITPLFLFLIAVQKMSVSRYLYSTCI